ncbi:MAG: hypothetical protein ACUVUE_05900 [Candidatus Bathycorpusculaceae bacterium]
MSERMAKVRSWDEFKRLIIKHKPDAIVYNIEQNGLSADRELTVLRLIVPAQDRYYIFIDFPEGEELRGTRIPLHKDKKGARYIEEEEVKDFLKTQFERKNLTICAYWTI